MLRPAKAPVNVSDEARLDSVPGPPGESVRDGRIEVASCLVSWLKDFNLPSNLIPARLAIRKNALAGYFMLRFENVVRPLF